MSTVEWVIAPAIDQLHGNTLSHVKQEIVLIQRLYKLLLLDPEVTGCLLYVGYCCSAMMAAASNIFVYLNSTSV